MKSVDIYTDGACSGNPGKGGWCAILLYGGKEKVLSGGDADTTNNRMEVYAAIAGLSALKEKCAVNLYSDSAYLVNAIEQRWLNNWKRNNWRTADKKEVKNQDLWRALDELLNKHEVTFIKVKGHADNEYNNRCDEYARGEIAKL
ncbi:MAG: ribonuclease HI [Clostridiales bacterium]|nr:ribonuclease HI [Clostridiales bacterium]